MFNLSPRKDILKNPHESDIVNIYPQKTDRYFGKYIQNTLTILPETKKSVTS